MIDDDRRVRVKSFGASVNRELPTELRLRLREDKIKNAIMIYAMQRRLGLQRRKEALYCTALHT
jgi:hypothetical protein